MADLRTIADELGIAAEDELARSPLFLILRSRSGVSKDAPRVTTTALAAHIRYDGTDTTLKIPFGTSADMAAAFVAAHTRRFGFGFEHRALTPNPRSRSHRWWRDTAAGTVWRQGARHASGARSGTSDFHGKRLAQRPGPPSRGPVARP